MLITTELLKRSGVWCEAIEAFSEVYPKGISYSKSWHQRMLRGELAEYEVHFTSCGIFKPLTLTAKNSGMVLVGHYGSATAGDFGTAIAGDFGTATAGYCGTAIAGVGGTAVAGNDGTATAGSCGVVSAGKNGRLSLMRNDANNCVSRISVAHIGEDGILQNTKYIIGPKGVFVIAKEKHSEEG